TSILTRSTGPALSSSNRLFQTWKEGLFSTTLSFDGSLADLYSTFDRRLSEPLLLLNPGIENFSLLVYKLAGPLVSDSASSRTSMLPAPCVLRLKVAAVSALGSTAIILRKFFCVK